MTQNPLNNPAYFSVFIKDGNLDNYDRNAETYKNINTVFNCNDFIFNYFSRVQKN